VLIWMRVPGDTIFAIGALLLGRSASAGGCARIHRRMNAMPTGAMTAIR